MKPLILSLIVLCTFSTIPTFSQSWQKAIGNSDLQISNGLISMEYINCWNGKGGMSGYISMPSSISGALFLTYRHSFTERFSFGVSAGYESLGGYLSYGNPKGVFGGYDGNSWHYNVRSYTIAFESMQAYFKRPLFMMYGYLGLGYTYFQDKYVFYSNISDPEFFYGQQGSILPSNPYTYHSIYWNAQVTPFGMRFGNAVAGFFEIGFGYKGLLNGGLAVRL